MEVYIDDMLVKTRERPDHMKHLQETFDLLRINSMKLNPLKCAFGVNSGKFMGFMVTQRGLKPIPFNLEPLWNLNLLPPENECNSCLAGWRPWAVHLSLYIPIKVVFHHPERGQTCRMGYRMLPNPYSNQTIPSRTAHYG